MAELIAIPLKKSSEIDIIKPLKNLIQSTYSTADKPEDYSEAIIKLNQQRYKAIRHTFEKYESSLDVIYRYYDQLCALEGKIPAHEVQIPFKWKDAFDKGSIFGSRISLTVSSLSFEKVCILFNIAALHSSVASGQSFDTDDGLKFAAKLLQQAAGIFQQLKNMVMPALQQDPTPDLSPDTLSALSSLMLAQAQEVFVQKAIHGIFSAYISREYHSACTGKVFVQPIKPCNQLETTTKYQTAKNHLKDQIVAKLSSQCEELYADCLKMFQRDSLRTLWDKDWIPLVAGKQAGFHAIAEFHQSLVCKANKNVGEEIARLEHSIELFKAAQQRSGRPNFFMDIMNKASRNIAEAKKDNDFIYHERIPDIKSLESVGKAALAKAIPLTTPICSDFQDLFADLVPVAVHQALAAYDVRKNEIVNTEIMKLRESTQMLNSVLASLNLPAAIEVTVGSALPQSILDKASAVTALGGISAVEKLITDLPESLKRNTDILDEAVRMLQEEKQADDSLRQQFKEKWTRTPSEKLTEMFRSNADKYRQIITNAVEADKVVREKFETHKPYMQLLSKSTDELQSAVPRGSNAVNDTSAVQTLRRLMEDVETMKAERDVIESELKSATVDMKATFMNALAQDGAISEPQMSVEGLGRIFGPLQKQVKESIQRQEKLVADIQNANSEFVRESGACAGGRDTILRQLAAAHDAYRELQNNLQEGTKFYNDLTQLLVVFQNKISDFCFARKTEKEELMKDLTQEPTRQGTASTPAMPSHFNNPEPRKEAPPRPPPPSACPTTSSAPQAVPSNLPYPVYMQGMPVPFGASSSAPYPSYVPPPMPQGYNPYGTMPYPATSNYPGFPQAPGYSGYPYPQQGYPQQQQPGYPQQQPGYPHPPQSGYPQQPQQPPPSGW